MKIRELKQSLKKDPPYSYYSFLQRRMSLVITWLLLKTFPSVSANAVTISMLPVSLFASGLLYYALVSYNTTLLFVAFLISILTYVLDGVDGNIARYKQTTSLRGVFLDRLVHNITSPIYFLAIGFAFYFMSDEILYLVLFIVVAIFSEYSPLDISQKDVDTLFIRQAVHQNTLNYDYHKHKNQDLNSNHKSTPVTYTTSQKMIKSILSYEFYYLTIFVDLYFFDNQFYVSSLLGSIYILGKIYVRSNIKKWEEDLVSVLEKLSVRDDKR